MDIIEEIGLAVTEGLVNCHCERCGCMRYALESARPYMDVEPFLLRLQGTEKDCFGCDPCHGAVVSNLVQKGFRGRDISGYEG